jgi:hypothetical protein
MGMWREQGARELVEPWEFDVEHLTVEEYEPGEGEDERHEAGGKAYLFYAKFLLLVARGGSGAPECLS